MKLSGLICALPKWMGGGHKRSKDHQHGVGGGWVTADGGRVASKYQPDDAIAKCYYCPRCGRETRYKLKPKAQASDGNNGSPADGSVSFREAV